MTLIIVIALIWGIGAASKSAKRRKAERAAHAYAIQRARDAARAAQLREEYRRQQAAAKEAYRQQQLAARAETARLISEERARMAEAKARARAEQEAIRAEKQAEKEAERRRKSEFNRQQAQADLDHYEAQRQGYIDLLDALEAELTAYTTTERRRATLQRQILATEERLHKIDQRRAKAYFIAQEAC